MPARLFTCTSTRMHVATHARTHVRMHVCAHMDRRENEKEVQRRAEMRAKLEARHPHAPSSANAAGRIVCSACSGRHDAVGQAARGYGSEGGRAASTRETTRTRSEESRGNKSPHPQKDKYSCHTVQPITHLCGHTWHMRTCTHAQTQRKTEAKRRAEIKAALEQKARMRA